MWRQAALNCHSCLLCVVGHFPLCGARLEVVPTVGLEGVVGAALDVVALHLLDEGAQGLLGLGVGVVHHAGALPVLAGARVHADGHAQLPGAALGLRLVLLHLDDGAPSRDLGHGYRLARESSASRCSR